MGVFFVITGLPTEVATNISSFLQRSVITVPAATVAHALLVRLPALNVPEFDFRQTRSITVG